ncbi:MAG: hypothetical protein Q7Q71_14235 [Verrucomicrobiota bacterium JB023]|nr:hypothetical protein [Verrucomicrobiota bacterium JB023]
MDRRSKSPGPRAFLPLLIASLVGAIFFPIIFYPWMAIEDLAYYQLNPLFGPSPLADRMFTAWISAPEANYIPLTWNLTTLLSELTAGSASAFHAFSLLLHALNGVLAFYLADRLGLRPLQSLLAVLLFSLHPLRVESVAWASSIKGLLATSFALASLLAQSTPRLPARSLTIIAFFAFSLLSKQTLLLLPAVHFLFSRIRSDFALSKKSMAILGILSVSAAFAAKWANMGNPLGELNQYLFGDIAPLRALAALGHYLCTQLFPSNLFPEYPASTSPLLIGAGCLSLLPLYPLARALMRRENPSLAACLYGAYLVLLFPVLGVVTTPLEFAADRLTYFPSFFFWASVVVFLSTRTWLQARIAISLGLAAMAICSFLTIQQLRHWKNEKALTRHILRIHPTHYLANFQSANRLARRGHFREALPFAQRLAQHHPYRYGTWQTLSRIHLSLGETDSSLDALDHALERQGPRQADLLLLKAEALRAAARYEDALAACTKASELSADPATVLYQKALIYLAANQPHEAAEAIAEALTLQPQSKPLLQLEATISEQLKQGAPR